MADAPFRQHIDQMLDTLNGGRVIDAIERFYAPDVNVYENDHVFAEDRDEALERQRPFIEPCSRFEADFQLLFADEGRCIAVLRNETVYSHPQYGAGQIKGIHVLYWHDGLVKREDYFTGDKADEVAAFWKLLSLSGNRPLGSYR